MHDAVDRSLPISQQHAALSTMALALELVSEAIVWTDAYGCIQWCNPAFKRLVDRSDATLSGQPLIQVLPLTLEGETVPPSMHPATWGATITQPHSGCYQFCQQQHSVTLDLTAAPLLHQNDTADAPGGVMLVMREHTPSPLKPPSSLHSDLDLLTTRREQPEAALRESEQRFWRVFDDTAVGMAVSSVSGSLLQVNAAYCRMLGYTEAELLTRTYQDITHPDDVAHDVEQGERLLAGQASAYHLEKRYVHKCGRIILGLLSLSLVRDEQQQPLYFVAQVQDISDRKQAELALQQLNQELELRVQRRTIALEQINQQLQVEMACHRQTEVALRKSEERFRTIFDNAPIAISLADAHTYNIVKVNQAHCALLGYSDAELATMTHVDITHPDDVHTNVDKVRQLLEGTITRFQIEKRFIQKNGNCIWTNITVTLIRDSDGRVYTMGMLEDISDRKQTEAALRENQQLLRLVMDSIPMTIAWKDNNLRYLGCNQQFALNAGLTAPEAVTGKSDFALPWFTQAEQFRADDRRVITSGQPRLNTEETLIKVGVERRWLRTSRVPLRSQDGTVVGVLCTSEDITDRKQAEERLKASLEEKEILLKEIHHRVKNNLQTVCSLLNLQAHSIQDPNILAPFKESQHRVNAMALIHEKLYQSESLANVNFADYVRHLATDLIYSYSLNASHIDLHIEVSAIDLSVDTAIPCGLIINELITNSIKYAFPKNGYSEIRISFFLSNSQHYLLSIGDNGVGIPEHLDWQNVSSLGLQLVQALVYRLRGKIELDRSRGSTFKISFPKPL